MNLRHHWACICSLAVGMLVPFAQAGGTLPWLRPYIDGEEVVGTTLEARYSADEDAPTPVIRWEKSDSRTGKPVLIRQGNNAESYDITAADAGKYLRIVVGGGSKNVIVSPWIGPVMTEEQAESINNRFDASKRYPQNVAAMQAELKERLKDAVYFTVDTGDLHGSPYAMIATKARHSGGSAAHLRTGQNLPECRLRQGDVRQGTARSHHGRSGRLKGLRDRQCRPGFGAEALAGRQAPGSGAQFPPPAVQLTLFREEFRDHLP